MDRYVTFSGYSLSHTDLVRSWVIASLSASCIVITLVSLPLHLETVSTQLFYFPILYATYFYPRKGIILSGVCAITYEILAYRVIFPDTSGLLYTTGQAVMFVCVAVVVAYFTERVNTSEARYRSIFEASLLGIILFDQNSFEIKLANTHAEKILGYSGEELSGRNFSELLFSPVEQNRFFERLGSNEDITNFEIRFSNKNREPIWVNLSWRRIDNNMVSCSLIDINTRKIAEKAAEENLAQYKLVTENSPTGIIIVRDEKIAYTNPAFAEFSGYSPQELVDTDPLLLIHKDDRLEFNRFFRERGTPKSLSDMTEYRFITKTGKIRLAALFFTPITQKGTPGVLINLVDLSEREQLKERIENDNERRREMLSTVAGELRSLLKPVMGYLNMLTDNPKAHGVTDETRAILDRVAKSVDRERQIINQMLELSVLDAGRIPLTYSVFAVTNLLNAVIDAGGYRLKAEITTDIPPGLTFEADETKISFVIDAMLSNAVNYSTFPRKIRIMYRSTPEDSMHRLSIQDNGVGITSAQLDEIFEPLRVPESGTTRRKSGRIGLSLSIAKKYIQMHGGYISVESIVNLGSTFSIHIPKHKPADEMNHAT